MAVSKDNNLILMGIGAALMVFAVLPPKGVVLDHSCAPIGLQAEISEKVWPNDFWQSQLDALVEAPEWQERLPAMLAKAKHETDWSVSPIESRMTRLSNPEALSNPNEQERQQAAEQRQRLEEIAWLSACESSIRQRMDH